MSARFVDEGQAKDVRYRLMEAPDLTQIGCFFGAGCSY